MQLFPDILINTFSFFNELDVLQIELLINQNLNSISAEETKNPPKKITLYTKSLEKASKDYFTHATLSSIPSHFYFYKTIKDLTTSITHTNRQLPYSDKASLDLFQPIPFSFFEELDIKFQQQKEQRPKKALNLALLTKIDEQSDLNLQDCFQFLSKSIQVIDFTDFNEVLTTFYLTTKNKEFFSLIAEQLNHPSQPEEEDKELLLIEDFNDLVFNRCSAELDWVKAKADSVHFASTHPEILTLYQNKIKEILEKTSPYDADSQPAFFKKLFRHIVMTKDPYLLESFKITHGNFFKENCERLNEIPFLAHANYHPTLKKIVSRRVKFIPSLELIYTLLEERKVEEAKVLITQIPPSAITSSFPTTIFLQIIKRLLFYKEKEMAHQILRQYSLPLEIANLFESMNPTKDTILNIVTPISSSLAIMLLTGLEKTLSHISSVKFAELTELFFQKITSHDILNSFRAKIAKKLAISKEMQLMEEWIEKIDDYGLKLQKYVDTYGAFLLFENRALDPVIKKFEITLQSEIAPTTKDFDLPSSQQELKATLHELIDNHPLENPDSCALKKLKEMIDDSETDLPSIHLNLIIFLSVSLEIYAIPFIAIFAERYLQQDERQNFLKNSFLIIMALLPYAPTNDEYENDFRLNYQAAFNIDNPFLQEIVMLFLNERFSEKCSINPYLVPK